MSTHEGDYQILQLSLNEEDDPFSFCSQSRVCYWGGLKIWREFIPYCGRDPNEKALTWKLWLEILYLALILKLTLLARLVISSIKYSRYMPNPWFSSATANRSLQIWNKNFARGTSYNLSFGLTNQHLTEDLYSFYESRCRRSRFVECATLLTAMTKLDSSGWS